MDYIKILEAIGTINTMIGVVLLTFPKKLGLIFLLIAAVIWIVYFYITNQYFLLVQNVTLMILNIIAIISWTKKGIK